MFRNQNQTKSKVSLGGALTPIARLGLLLVVLASSSTFFVPIREARASAIDQVTIGGGVTADEANCAAEKIKWDVQFQMNRKGDMNIDGYVQDGTVYPALDETPPIVNITFNLRSDNPNSANLIAKCDENIEANGNNISIRLWAMAGDKQGGLAQTAKCAATTVLPVAAYECYKGLNPAQWFDVSLVPNILGQKGQGRYGGSFQFPQKKQEILAKINQNWVDNYVYLTMGGWMCSVDCGSGISLMKSYGGKSSYGAVIGAVYNTTANAISNAGAKNVGEEQIGDLPKFKIRNENVGEKKALKDISITLKHRDKYRLALTDTSFNFGSTISADWTDSKSALMKGQVFLLPKQSDSWFDVDLNPAYDTVSLGVNYSKNISNEKGKETVCPSSLGVSLCQDIIFGSPAPSAKYKSNFGSPSGKGTLPETSGKLQPVISPDAWKDEAQWTDANKSAESGKPIGKIKFTIVPIIWGWNKYIIKTVLGSDNVAVLMTTNKADFDMEIYADEASLKQSCLNEKKDDPTFCDDPNKIRYEMGQEVSTTTGTPQAEDKGLIQDIFDFIRWILVACVSLLTALLYSVFAYILVPILVALLNVKPFSDQFVEVIYPGWLIMRNLANVAFIVSLLVVGMRILFQQDQAGKSWQFIRTLVIMALLVNFSLVIAQGVVGIADTFQSQFLPGDSNVIETLGTKLMAEPIQNFGKQFLEGGKVTTASDLFYPVVLWWLALMSFFGFVVIAAFIFIRLVALWILYMVSPIAYFGPVLGEGLPQAKEAGSKWWTEFVRYTITVPILAFFLNIAALMAVVFSNKSGTAVQVLGAKEGRFTQGAANSITEFALTIATHFIVLIFLYMGMLYAQKSGVFGADTIIKYASKGFNWTRKAPGKALKSVKDWTADKAATLAESKGKPGLAKAIQRTAQPIDFAKLQYKQAREKLAESSAERQARIQGRLGKLDMADPLKGDREGAQKYKDFSKEEKSSVLNTMLTQGNAKGSRELLISAFESGGHTAVLKTMEKFSGGKKYERNAAGLQQAIEDLGNKQGWGQSRIERMKVDADRTAARNNKTKHYSGGMELGPDNKRSSRKLDSSNPDGRFVNHDQWVDDQANRNKGGGWLDFVKNADKEEIVKVEKQPDGSSAELYTDQMKALLATFSDETFTNPEVYKKFYNNDSDVAQAIKKLAREISKTQGTKGFEKIIEEHYATRGGVPDGVDISKKASNMNEFLRAETQPTAFQAPTSSGGGTTPPPVPKPAPRTPPKTPAPTNLGPVTPSGGGPGNRGTN